MEHAHHAPPGGANSPGAIRMKDPVCGMPVTKQSAHHLNHQGYQLFLQRPLQNKVRRRAIPIYRTTGSREWPASRW